MALKINKIKLALVCLWGALVLFAAFKKIQSQSRSRTVEICVSWRETRELIGREPEPLGNSPRTAFLNFLERCRIIGVRSVAVQEEIKDGVNAGFDTAQMDALKSFGLSYAYLVDESGPFLPGLQNLPALPAEGPGQMTGGSIKIKLEGSAPQSSWIFAADAVDLSTVKLHFMDEIAGEVQNGNAAFALFEAQPRKYQQVRTLARRLPAQTVRSHAVSVEDMKVLPREALLSRWVRAVQERSCKLLYIHWNPDWSAEENLSILRDLARRLKSRGFTLGLAKDSLADYQEYPNKPLRLFLAWILAVLTPTCSLIFIKRKLPALDETPRFKDALKIWGAGVLIAVLGGLSLSCFLNDTVFVNGLEVFRGVKAALILPIVFAGLILLSPGQMEEFFNRSVTVRDLLAALIVVLGLGLMIERSGNFSSHVSVFEIGVREKLEDLLGTRPRFKEFLFGHPLLIAGLYFKRSKALSAACLWAGMLALVSTVNSFCHLHTPLTVTLLRTVHGLWLGGLFGAALVWTVNCYKNFTKS